MKMKNCGVYAALAAVLLVSAVLVTNCVDPVGILTGTQETGQSSLPPPPPGKAYLRVILPDAGRTILPDLPTIANYSVSIRAVGGSGPNYSNSDGDSSVDFTTGYAETFTVNAGRYFVTVSGYTGAITGTPVAIGQDLGPEDSENAGSYLGVNVVASTGGSASVKLEKIMSTGATGTFYYNLGLPSHMASATGTSATISSTLYPTGAGITFTTPNLLTSATGTINNVPAGFYWVDVTLQKTKYQSVTYSQIVHIYGGQTSRWGVSGTAAPLVLNKNKWDVTLNANGGSLGDGGSLWDNDGDGWDNGGTVDEPSGDYIPERVGYSLAGWFTEAGTGNAGGGTQWNFTSSKIYKDTPLYAGWASTPTGPLVITITPYVHVGEGTFDFGAGGSTLTIPHADALAGDIATTGPDFSVTVALTDGTNPYFDGFDGWFYFNPSTLARIRITNSSAGGNVLTNAKILAAIPSFEFAVSGAEFKFIFVGIIDDEPYNGEFVIEIEQP